LSGKDDAHDFIGVRLDNDDAAVGEYEILVASYSGTISITLGGNRCNSTVRGTGTPTSTSISTSTGSIAD